MLVPDDSSLLCFDQRPAKIKLRYRRENKGDKRDVEEKLLYEIFRHSGSLIFASLYFTVALGEIRPTNYLVKVPPDG